MSTALEQEQVTQGEIYHGFQANLKPAPFFKRFLASCVDYGILSAVMYVYLVAGLFVFGLLMAFFAAFKSPTLTGVLSIILISILVLIALGTYHVYFIYFEYKKGRTPGKKLFGLSVVTDDGSPRTKSKMIIRELFRYVDSLFIPALICMAVTDRRQRIGDLMAGTFVAHSATQESKNDFMYIKQEDYNYISALVEPSQSIDQAFMDDFLVFASSNFLRGIKDSDMRSPYYLNMETKVRTYFTNESHQRLDGRSALLFFAEHCYQVDLKRREEQKG